MQKRSGKIASLLAASLLTALLAGCSAGVEQEVPALAEPVSVNVDTYRVARDEIYEIETYDAEVIPVTTDVVAEYSGLLGELLIKEGDPVEEGQLVAQLSDTAVQAQLEMVCETIQQTGERNRLSNEIAEYDIELLQLDLTEAKAAAEPDETRIQDLEFRLEEAELSLRQQKEKQELAMGRLEEQKQALEEQIVDCDIVAPTSGRVAYVAGVQEGGMLLEGMVLAVIASDQLQLRTDFLTDGTFRNADSCHIYYGGQEIAVQNLPYERNDYVAAVLRNGSFYTYYTLAEQPADMMAGDYAQLRIIKNRAEDVLTIPVTCLYRDGVGSYVYVIDEAGNRIKTPVATGVRNDIMVEITDGLAEGDEVYVKN